MLLEKVVGENGWKVEFFVCEGGVYVRCHMPFFLGKVELSLGMLVSLA